MNITRRTGLAASSSRATVPPSTVGSRKSGHGVPRGTSRFSVSATSLRVTPGAPAGRACYGWPVDVIADLPAVRPGRLARVLGDLPLADEARALRPYLRGASPEDLPSGVRLGFALELIDLATLATLVR